MSGRENLECKSWFNNFIRQFRRRYNDLPESIHKFVWDIDNFSATCQLISIVLSGKEFTFLWVRRDPELPDMEIRCFGPLSPNEFTEIGEEILSDKSLYKKFSEEEIKDWHEQSFGNFLENELIWVSKIIQNPSTQVIGYKYFRSRNGFFWMVNGDITKIDAEPILKEIFEGASARAKSHGAKDDKAAETQTRSEKLLSGYSTYLYPPAWIGKEPTFDFRARVNGILILQPSTIKVEYKNSIITFNQKGLFFVGLNNRKKCIRFMNEIIGVAILQGYNLDAITDLDIGETSLTESKGEIRHIAYPKSISRYQQTESMFRPITEEQIASCTKIGADELLRIVKIAEKASIDSEASVYLIFLRMRAITSGMVNTRNHSFSIGL